MLVLTRGAELPGSPQVPHQTGSPPLAGQDLGLGVILGEALPEIRCSSMYTVSGGNFSSDKLFVLFFK